MEIKSGTDSRYVSHRYPLASLLEKIVYIYVVGGVIAVVFRDVTRIAKRKHTQFQPFRYIFPNKGLELYLVMASQANVISWACY